MTHRIGSTHAGICGRATFTQLIVAALAVALPIGAAGQGGFFIGPQPPGSIPDVSPPSPQIVQIIDGSGNAQELGPVNSATTKLGVIHKAVPPMLGTTNPNPGVDINTIWLGSNTFPSAADPTKEDIWVYFAWARDKANGSGVLQVEFQQSPQPAGCVYDATGTVLLTPGTCNPWAGRQAKDFILVWDQQGGTIDIVLREWNAVGGGLVLGPGVSLSAFGCAAASLSVNGLRGEAAVNLTCAGVLPTVVSNCLTVANVLPGTVTGNSDSADYKDTVLFDFAKTGLSISNCGRLVLRKDSSGGLPNPGPQGTFPWDLTRAGGGVILFGETDGPADDVIALTDTFTGDYRDLDEETVGSFVFEDVNTGGDYVLAEKVPPAWTLVSIVCTVDGKEFGGDAFPVIASAETICTITNAQNTGFLRVRKIVEEGAGLTATPDQFSYTVDIQDGDDIGPVAFPANPDLPSGFFENEHELASGTIISGVTEVELLDDWLDSYENCENLTIQPDVTVTCIVTNTPQKNDAEGKTRQRVLAFDKLVIEGLRRTQTVKKSTANFTAYRNAQCEETSAFGSETVEVSYPNDTDVQTVMVETQQGIEIKFDGVGEHSTTVYWRVEWFGDENNNPFHTPCRSESTTVTFVQNP